MWGLIFLEVPTPSLLLAYAHKGFAYPREHVGTCACASLRAWVLGWICLPGHSVSNIWKCFVVGCGLVTVLRWNVLVGEIFGATEAAHFSHRFVSMLTSPRNSAKKRNSKKNWKKRAVLTNNKTTFWEGFQVPRGGLCARERFRLPVATFRLSKAYAGRRYIFACASTARISHIKVPTRAYTPKLNAHIQLYPDISRLTIIV